jgi:hypothetical protein
MIDESFFDANGQVVPERVDEFVTDLSAQCAKGRRISFTGPAMIALARAQRAEAQKIEAASRAHARSRSARHHASVAARAASV